MSNIQRRKELGMAMPLRASNPFYVTLCPEMKVEIKAYADFYKLRQSAFGRKLLTAVLKRPQLVHELLNSLRTG